MNYQDSVKELKKRLPDFVFHAGPTIRDKGKEWCSPCFLCGGSDRLFWSKTPGTTNAYCRGCEKSHSTLDIYMHKQGLTEKDIPSLLKEFGLEPDQNPVKKTYAPNATTSPLPTKEESPQKQSSTKTKQLKKNRNTWKKSTSKAPEVITYLQEQRSVPISEDFPLPGAIKYQSWKTKTEKFSCLICCLVDLTNLKDVTDFQRIWLDPEDGTKTGTSLSKESEFSGKAIWLDPKRPLNEESILIGEGLESVLSAVYATGLTGAACTSTSLLKKINIPKNVTEINIFCDEDSIKPGAKKGFAGQKAALALGKRFEKEREGNVAYIVSPSNTCFTDIPSPLDFNDLLKNEEGHTGQSIRDRFAARQKVSDVDWTSPDGKKEDDAEEEEDDTLLYMQGRFVYMRDGNRMIDTDKPPQHAVMALAEFKQAFRKHGFVFNGEGKPKLAVNAFFDDMNYRSVVGERYHPNEKIIYSADDVAWFNPANFPQWPETNQDDKIAGMVEHLKYLFPNSQYERFIDWLAWTVCEPGTRLMWTPLLISKHQGTGRGLLVNMIERLLGVWNTCSVDIDELAGQGSKGQYHNFLHNTVFCPIHEVYVSGNAAYEVDSAIRSKLTESYLYLNLKYGKSGNFPIFANFLMMSNELDALALKEGDRRIEVFEHHAKSKVPEDNDDLPNDEQVTYYKELYDAVQFDEGFNSQMFWFLQRHYLARKGIFDPKGRARMSAAKKRMIGGTSSDIEIAFKGAVKIVDGDIITAKIIRKYMIAFMMSAKGGEYPMLEAEEMLNGDDENKTARHIGMLCKRNFTLLLNGKKIAYSGQEQARCYAINNEDMWVTATRKDVRNQLKNTWDSAQNDESVF